MAIDPIQPDMTVGAVRFVRVKEEPCIEVWVYKKEWDNWRTLYCPIGKFIEIMEEQDAKFKKEVKGDG
jgi:hypothetical protein